MVVSFYRCCRLLLLLLLGLSTEEDNITLFTKMFYIIALTTEHKQNFPSRPEQEQAKTRLNDVKNAFGAERRFCGNTGTRGTGVGL